PEAVVPRRAERQRLGAKPLLRRLVDVEARDLERRHLPLRARVALQELAAAARRRERPEAGRVQSATLQQRVEEEKALLAVADGDRATVDDERQQVLPQEQPLEEGGLRQCSLAGTRRTGVETRVLCSRRSRAHWTPPPICSSKAAAASKKSRFGASTT